MTSFWTRASSTQFKLVCPKQVAAWINNTYEVISVLLQWAFSLWSAHWGGSLLETPIFCLGGQYGLETLHQVAMLLGLSLYKLGSTLWRHYIAPANGLVSHVPQTPGSAGHVPIETFNAAWSCFNCSGFLSRNFVTKDFPERFRSGLRTGHFKVLSFKEQLHPFCSLTVGMVFH